MAKKYILKYQKVPQKRVCNPHTCSHTKVSKKKVFLGPCKKNIENFLFYTSHTKCSYSPKLCVRVWVYTQFFFLPNSLTFQNMFFRQWDHIHLGAKVDIRLLTEGQLNKCYIHNEIFGVYLSKNY